MLRTTASAALLCVLFTATSIAAPLTEQERQRLIAHLNMTEGWLVDEVSGLSQAQLEYRRAPGTWTILQVVDHLLVVGPIYWQDLQNAMKGRSGQRSPASDADILWYGINRTHRETAIPTEVPKGITDLRAGLETYRKLHARLVDYIRTTKDDLRGHIVGRQSCDAYQWALLISTHEQRHILQIREIKSDAGFPKK